MSDNIKRENVLNKKEFLISLVFGLVIGAGVYSLTKIFKLNEWYWYLAFMFFPPIVGAFIYKMAKKLK